MVVDTSAVVAILFRESDFDRYALAIEAAETLAISAATVIEAGVVLLSRGGPDMRGDLYDFLAVAGLEIEPVTAAQSKIALDAYERFGKGMGSGANLNLGDCFAYALAKERNDILLFKGNDFSKTDVKPALV